MSFIWLAYLLTSTPTTATLQKNNLVSNMEKNSPTTSSKTKANKTTHPVIQESLQNGRFIRLSDNSLWEINPGDRPITQSWITPVEIIAEPSNDATYPTRLTNTLTGSSVLARRADASAKSQPNHK